MSQSEHSAGIPPESKKLMHQIYEAQEKIGYLFNDLTLLERALTHGSATNPNFSVKQNYQRLEFLGDRVLGLSIATLLLQAFPDADEGELGRRYSSLVNNNICAEVARELKLERTVITGATKIKFGSKQGTSILADVCEAIIASIYLDADFQTAFEFVQKHWQKRIATNVDNLRDPKTTLQEFSLKKQKKLPIYEVTKQTGEDHQPTFEVTVNVTGFKSSTGTGSSKQSAEQDAAKKFLERENF